VNPRKFANVFLIKGMMIGPEIDRGDMTFRGRYSAKGLSLVIVLMLLVVSCFTLLTLPLGGTAQPGYDMGDAPCSDCHDGGDNDTIMTVSGIPAQYNPSQAYVITIDISDSNGAGVGENSIVINVTVGTLTTSDVNLSLVSSTEAVSTNDYDVTQWTLTWTAPTSGDVTFDAWGIAGDGSGGRAEETDNDIHTSTLIPEFPTLMIPIVSVVALLFIMVAQT